MDLSNWGPVGTPDQIATWLGPSPRPAWTTSSAASARSTSTVRSSASRGTCCRSSHTSEWGDPNGDRQLRRVRSSAGGRPRRGRADRAPERQLEPDARDRRATWAATAARSATRSSRPAPRSRRCATSPRSSPTSSPDAASCCSTTARCAFAQGDALYIPSGVWHAVSNTGDDDAVMVFGFPHPDYPPTERRA